ncbi:MAG TPA: MlaD family protein [Sphingobacteriaceae bacterium]|nr:MlaD family protein [Sphingobacteriaceae bacterium]
MKINKEFKIGLMVTVALAILIIGYSFLKGNDVFSKDNTYYAAYDRVDGLTVSKPILVNGYQIGRVSKMELQADGRILTQLKVKKEYAIPQNTIAQIITTDLLGGKAIVFELGNSPNYATDGSHLQAGMEKGLWEQVQPIQKKAEDIAVVLDSVLSSINNTINAEFQRDFNRSITSIANSLKNIEGITGQLDALVGKERVRVSDIMANVESITANIQKNNEQITGLLSNLNQITDQVARANVANTLADANQAVADFQKIVDRINSGEKSIGLLINDSALYDNLRNASKNLDELMIDLKEHPGRYVHFSIFGRRN